MPGFNKDVGEWQVGPKIGSKIPYNETIGGGNQFGAAMTRDHQQAVCTGWVRRPSDGLHELWLFRTTGDWRDIVAKSQSVERVCEITPGWIWWWSGSTYGDNDTVSSAVTLIDGTLYVSCYGKGYLPSSRGYNGVWRDTSPNGDGSGPWVEHGVIYSAGLGGGNMTGPNFNVAVLPGHITVTPNGTWLSQVMGFQNFGTTATGIRPGIARSFDGGVSWTRLTNNGHYIVGGFYGDNAPSQAAYSPLSGHVYSGSTGQGDNYYQSVADFGAGGVTNWGGGGPWPIFGDQTYAYTVSGALYRTPWTGSPPERMTPLTNRASGLNFSWSNKSCHASVLGPPDDQFIALCSRDRILSLLPGGGWQVGSLGFG